MKTARHFIPVVATVLYLCISPRAAAAPACAILPEPKQGQRYLVVISDLHFGLGKSAEGKWNASEDFRWSNALKGFIDQVSKCGNDNVDLVVAGDMLELWQPPDTIACAGPSKNTGCSLGEVGQLVDQIIEQHRVNFETLGRFTFKGGNRLHIVPGNHDAALMLPTIWSKVSAAIKAKSGGLELVGGGAWASSDGKVLVEHGHQIGKDVNKFAEWPKVHVEGKDGNTFMQRPWGEQFVQVLFNTQELAYPIIDNLSPESAGARYRMADRGLWPSVADVARFVQFNLFETSVEQKSSLLGSSDSSKPPEWDLQLARSKGYKLFADALPADDPFRITMQSDSADAKELQRQLTIIAADKSALTDPEVVSLCNLAAIRTSSGSAGCTNKLGALAQGLLRSRRDVLQEHLNIRMSDPAFRELRMFIYGHTHQLEEGWEVATKRWNVSVFNTGAFQRTIDDEEFRGLASARMEQPSRALKTLDLNDLGTCYSAVFAALGGTPVGRTVRWHMDESGPGAFVLPGDKACLPAALRLPGKGASGVK